MEYTQDLHLKMSKKIAQLTKVRLRLPACLQLRASVLLQGTSLPQGPVPSVLSVLLNAADGNIQKYTKKKNM